ncbi:LysR family transcriptional regulator [bacterium]|nr:LysR family transcriptional regulator [bacterium]
MNIDVLEEFVTLSITRNFSSAAEQLRISQPSLSRHIKALETEMGSRLVERESPIMLTAAGKEVLNMATTVLSTVAASKRAIAQGKSVTSGESFTIEDEFYCPCFSEFIYRYGTEAQASGMPRIEVRALTPGKTAYECILERRLDFTTVTGVGIEGSDVKAPPVPEGLVTIPMPNSVSRVCFLASGDNPLARRGDVRLRDFESVPIMMPISAAFDYERRCVTHLFETYAGFTPRFAWQQVNTLQEFFSLNPRDAVFFTTDALSSRYQQYSTWVLENTVPVHPADAKYVRQIFLVMRANADETQTAVARKIGEIWASAGYYGE